MKKIFCAVLLFISFQSFGQDNYKPGIDFEFFWDWKKPFFGEPANYVLVNQRYNWMSGKFRNALTVPAAGSAAYGASEWRYAGGVMVDTVGADSGFYYIGTGQTFRRLADYASLSGFFTPNQS